MNHYSVGRIFSSVIRVSYEEYDDEEEFSYEDYKIEEVVWEEDEDDQAGSAVVHVIPTEAIKSVANAVVIGDILTNQVSFLRDGMLVPTNIVRFEAPFNLKTVNDTIVKMYLDEKAKKIVLHVDSEIVGYDCYFFLIVRYIAVDAYGIIAEKFRLVVRDPEKSICFSEKLVTTSVHHRGKGKVLKVDCDYLCDKISAACSGNAGR